MLRYQCPRCHEITHRDEPTTFCGICCGPLAEANLIAESPSAPRVAQPGAAASLADLLNARDKAREAARAAYSM